MRERTYGKFLKKNEGIKFDKEFKLAFKKCKL